MMTIKYCRALGLVLCGLLTSVLASQSLAESYIYLTNNTMQTLSLETTQTGHNNIEHGNQWQQLAHSVPPLGTVKFLRFNRDQGIKWGRELVRCG